MGVVDLSSNDSAETRVVQITDAESHSTFFLRVPQYRGRGHPFRADVTDGQTVWQADVVPPDDYVQNKEAWLSRASEALAGCCSYNADVEKVQEYRVTFSLSGTSLKIQWKWGEQNIKNGVSASALGSSEGKRAIAGMLADLIGQNKALTDSSQRLEALADELKDVNIKLVAEHRAAADKQQRIEETLLQKFASVLNEKKGVGHANSRDVSDTGGGGRESALAVQASRQAGDTAVATRAKTDSPYIDDQPRQAQQGRDNDGFDTERGMRQVGKRPAAVSEPEALPKSPSAEQASPAIFTTEPLPQSSLDERGARESGNLFSGESLPEAGSLKIRKRPRKFK